MSWIGQRHSRLPLANISIPDLGARSGHSRLKRGPRVRNWLALAVAVGVLTTPLFASAEDNNRDKASPGLIVATETGQVRGLRVDGVDKFLAIPYAAPPTGALRWKPPAAASNWTDVRDATKFARLVRNPPAATDLRFLMRIVCS